MGAFDQVVESIVANFLNNNEEVTEIIQEKILAAIQDLKFVDFTNSIENFMIQQMDDEIVDMDFSRVTDEIKEIVSNKVRAAFNVE